MRKLYYFLVFLITLVVIAYFATTPYFFNKYIVPNIKSYNFDYKSVKGTLLTGFKVEHLKYKNKELSSLVELKFNPFALLEKKISISKLVLEDVDKEVLKELIDDFKKDTNSSSESSSSLNLDFVLKNIHITFKPFRFNNLEVYNNSLKIKGISFIDGKLNLERNSYYYDTNIGKLEFEGEFQNKVLYIDNLSLKDVDIKKTLEFLKTLESKENNETNNTSSSAKESILFIPKKIEIKNLFASLKPFKYKNIDVTALKLKGRDIKIDVEKKKLYKAILDLEFITSISDFNTKIILENGKLTIPDLEIALLNSNELLSFLNSLQDKKAASKKVKKEEGNLDILEYLSLKEVKIETLVILLKQFSFNKERIKKATLFAKDIIFNIPTKKLSIAKNRVFVDSTLAKIEVKGKINNSIYIKSFQSKVDNGDRLLKFIDELNTTKNEDTNSSFDIFKVIPSTLIIKNSNLKLKKLTFEPYKIKDGEIALKNGIIDLKKGIVKKAKAKLSNSSNWGDALLEGEIRKNIFYAKGEAKITQALLDEYDVPLKANNLEPIKVDGRFSLDDLDIKAYLKGRDILKTIKDIDILSSENRVYYNYNSSKTIWDLDALVSHPFINRAKLKNHLSVIDDRFSYKGELIAKDNLKIDKKFQEFLKDLRLIYKGDSKKIELKLLTNALEGELLAKEYKKGILKIKNRKTIDASKLIGLKSAKIKKLLISSPVDFNNILNLKGDIFIDSTPLKLKGEWRYNKSFSLKGKILDSKMLPQEIKKKALFPIRVELNLKDRLNLTLKNALLSSKIDYNLKNDSLDIKTKTNAFSLNAKGNSKNLTIDLTTSSIARTLREIKRVYPLKLDVKVDGKLKANIKTNFKKYAIKLSSNEIKIIDKKNITKIKNININALYANDELIIKSYKFKVKEFNFFASEPSRLRFKKDTIIIKRFVINNKATLTGEYNLKRQRGTLKLKAKSFKFKNADYDVNLNANLIIKIIKDRYSIEGVVDIIKAIIKKNLQRSNGVESDDIIILQQQAKKKSSFYVKKLKLNLKIKSQKGIIYAQDGSYFIAYPKLKIRKNFNQFTKIDGVIIIDKRSYYSFKGKKFRVKRGKVTFKGNSSLAYLNILMYYKGREYTIYINITGNSSRPVIFFSSNPPLTKEQILAYLLFNDTSAAGTHSQESMLNLVGGALAQSFFGSIGLKIDKISIKENGFSIGKAINDKVIIYYNQEGEKPSIKTRIDITKSIHSVIEIGEDKQSADIIFSKEY